MAVIFDIQKTDHGYAIARDGKALKTPAQAELIVPSQALAEAIAGEWRDKPKFSPSNMPLTSLAYTAIDRIGTQAEAIIEALLVYVDTETLSYRVTGSEALAKKQDEQWGEILTWAKSRFGVTWETTSGVMPIEQPQLLSQKVGDYLRGLDAFALAAACILSSGFSSLALTLAVLEKKLNAGQAFLLSRLEEEASAEQWGRDAEADLRAKRLENEILAAEQFLRLL